jgi:hypothetical protein
VPRALKRQFPSSETVITVPEAGYAGLKNGELLRAADGKFDVFLTTDANMQHQQTLRTYSMAFVLVRARSNDIFHLVPLMPKVVDRLRTVAKGQLLIIA